MKQILVLFCLVSMPPMDYFHPEKRAIKEVILQAYVEGRILNQDTLAMKTGFDENFIMFIRGQQEVSQLNVNEYSDWVARSSDTDPAPDHSDITWSFPMISIADHSAVARIEVRLGNDHILTDFFSLYKVDGQWKIVGKVYQSYR